MLPILQASADDNDTLTTVINRFDSINKHMGQKHTIITGDLPLYSRGKELVWANPEYENVIWRMGGLHVCFNFLKAIGQHMDSAGLDDLWVDSGVYAANTTDTMLEGKAYYRAVRGHTLTYEALWRVIWPMFNEWLRVNDHDEHVQIRELSTRVGLLFQLKGEEISEEVICNAVRSLTPVLADEKIKDLMDTFDKQFKDNPNYMLWKSYMRMVEILLQFIRAERGGDWHLHLEAFTAMLPWLTLYDHTNYARWGPIYLADMKALPKIAPEVHEEFVAGNFVVKRANRRFNQIPPDQGTEWMNRACKVQNGIIGITRNDQARDKFCMTWSNRSRISLDTRRMLDLEEAEEEAVFTRTDALPSRIRRDTDDVEKIVQQLKRFNVFRIDFSAEDTSLEDGESDTPVALVSLATKDIATAEIVTDLLTAESRGRQHVATNVEQRLAKRMVPFHDAIKKHNSKTFAVLYKAIVSGQQSEKKTIKADRNLFQRLLNAATAGRNIEMGVILKHELSIVPLALAKHGGEMNSTPKFALINLLTNDIQTPAELPDTNLSTCVCVDGHALIQQIGKPSGCQTFGEYAAVFTRAVVRHFGEHTTRVDVVFDRYLGTTSIKESTRKKRIGKKKPIRRMIDGPHVPLPVIWEQYIAMGDNKADLARFLSGILEAKGRELPQPWELVIAGGFTDLTDAKSTRREHIPLHANHEEADTRLILHALDCGYQRVVVFCRDTDVLVMLIYFLAGQAAEIWMVSGTAKKQKCYPVKLIADKLPGNVKDNIVGFHALTGCDTTSSFTGYGKKTCWKLYQEQPHLLSNVGRGGDDTASVKFVCHLYGSPEEEDIDKVRFNLFTKGKKDLGKLPPTKDALLLHIARANHQAKIWLQADKEQIDMPDPASTGAWTDESGVLRVLWKRLPSVPDACLELIACKCKTKCGSARCSCFKKDMRSTPACACNADDCNNPAGL